jgi:hypothetical protein
MPANDLLGQSQDLYQIESQAGSRAPSETGPDTGAVSVTNSKPDQTTQRRAARNSKKLPGPAKENQLAFYPMDERQVIIIAKEKFALQLCLVDAFPSSADALSYANEALIQACKQEGRGMPCVNSLDTY